MKISTKSRRQSRVFWIVGDILCPGAESSGSLQRYHVGPTRNRLLTTGGPNLYTFMGAFTDVGLHPQFPKAAARKVALAYEREERRHAH